VTVFRTYSGGAQSVICLQCAHSRLSEPPAGNWREVPCADHLAERQCEWDWRHAREYVRAANRAIKIRCTLFPEWKEYWSNHFCGQFEPNALPTIESADQYLNGTWRDQVRERLEADNKKLQKELKIARQRSATRLKRLQQVTAKANGHLHPAPLDLSGGSS